MIEAGDTKFALHREGQRGLTDSQRGRVQADGHNTMLGGAPVQVLNLASAAKPHAKLRRYAEQMERLLAFITDLNRVQAMDELFQTIGRTAVGLAGTGRVAIFLREPDGADRCAWRQGLSVEFAARAAALGAPVQAHQSPLLISDVRALPEDAPARRLATAEGYRAVGMWPLVYERGVTGSLACYYDDVQDWAEPGREVVQAFCTQAAVAIENGRLRDAQKRKTAEQQVLLSLSRHLRVARTPEEMYKIVCEQALGFAGAQFAGINLLDPGRRMMTRVYAIGPDGGRVSGQTIPVPGSMSETAMKTAAALRGTDFWRRRPGNWAPAYYEQLGPFIIVPLRSDEEIIGTLLLARDRADGRPFEDDEVRLLESIGEVGGESIRRARLFAEAGRRLDQLEALRAIDMAITGSFDLRLTLNIVLERTMARLGVDAADVLVFDPRTQTLRMAASRGFRTPSPRVPETRLGEGIGGRAALDRKMVAVPDLRRAPDGMGPAPHIVEEQFVACYAVPLIAKGQIRGVLEAYHHGPLAPEPEWLEFLEAIAGQTAIAVENGTILEDLQRTYVELALAYDGTIEGWSRALDLRDNETEGHTKRVTDFALQLARQLNVSTAEFTHLRRGALLRDIGKMGIPDKILLKPGPLTDEEWVIMRRHPVYAHELLSTIPYLRPALDIPYCHHEKWDGTGYPRGLKGEQIPLVARIFAVVDVWDALRSDRPYRKAWTSARAQEYIREQSGTHFDPKVVDAFLKMGVIKDEPVASAR